MKYQANPVIVDAFKIVSIGLEDKDGNVPLALDNGENVLATPAMYSRYRPHDEDYWVIQSDGYVYLNPKDVFERKYSPVILTAEMPREGDY